MVRGETIFLLCLLRAPLFFNQQKWFQKHIKQQMAFYSFPLEESNIGGNSRLHVITPAAKRSSPLPRTISRSRPPRRSMAGIKSKVAQRKIKYWCKEFRIFRLKYIVRNYKFISHLCIYVLGITVPECVNKKQIMIKRPT